MSFARTLYTLAWLPVLPFLPLKLWWRGRREPGYLEHVGERFGRYAGQAPEPTQVFVHAVSLGETRAAAPLLRALGAALPGRRLLLTHMTATGRAAGKALVGAEDPDAPKPRQAWLPYDVPFAVAPFLDHFQPAAGLLIETELWPNLIAAAHARGVPMFLVNARLSQRSARRYARWASLTLETLRGLRGVLAQTQSDAQRFLELGAQTVEVTGNLKFDVPLPADLEARTRDLRSLWGERPVWVAASTREGEEALILDAMPGSGLPEEALLVLVPRHPQRFDEVERLVRARGLRIARRSANARVDEAVRVVLGDSVGELLAYYAAAGAAIVGGSLVPLGGQNLIEACAVGCPVVIGPHTFNFTEASEGAVAAGAARRVVDAADALRAVSGLLADDAARGRAAAAGRSFAAAHRGATQRTLAALGRLAPGVFEAGSPTSPGSG